MGLAVGDGLGAPFEGHPHPEHHHVTDWMAADRPLRTTDDTAQALALTEAMAHHGPDPDAVAAALAETWQHDPDAGYGPGAAATLRARPGAGALDPDGTQTERQVSSTPVR